MFRRIAYSSLVTAVSMLGVPAAVAHPGGQANAGYVSDNKGHIALDGSGKCLKTSAWTPALAISECEGGAPKAAAPAPVAAAPVAARPAPAPEKVMEKVTLSAGALFDVNKATLRPPGKRELDSFAAKVKLMSINSIVVTGHTDSAGSDAYNQSLSEDRAASVKAYLVSQGVDGDRIRTVGKGESDPAADNGSAAGREKNRRVEIDLDATRNSR